MSRICADVNEDVQAFRDRDLDGYPYVFLDATWQRCRVHWLRNLLPHVPKGHAEMVAAAMRTIFSQPAAAGSW